MRLRKKQSNLRNNNQLRARKYGLRARFLWRPNANWGENTSGMERKASPGCGQQNVTKRQRKAGGGGDYPAVPADVPKTSSNQFRLSPMRGKPLVLYEENGGRLSSVKENEAKPHSNWFLRVEEKPSFH
jgi:hypothetical protein